MLLLYAIPIGILLGLVAGGRLAALGTIHFRLWPLALGGLLFQLMLFSPPVAREVGALGPPLYVASTLVVLAALLFNLGQPGFRLILVGAALNLTVVVANGGQMPASPEALLAVYGAAAVPAEHFSNSVLAGSTTHLALLGDIFYLPRPVPLANVFSIGDVLIALGGAWFVAGTMRRGARRGPRTPATVQSVAPLVRATGG
jgi:hypothetical protein